jgi:hypothetical protein
LDDVLSVSDNHAAFLGEIKRAQAASYQCEANHFL